MSALEGFDFYVVVLERPARYPAEKPVPRAEVVQARTATDAVEMALEGERWETDDGRYTASVGRLADLEHHVAHRKTEVTILVTEAATT